LQTLIFKKAEIHLATSLTYFVVGIGLLSAIAELG